MMKLEEFAEAVLKEIRRKAARELTVKISGVTKNNGVKLTGIIATEEGSSSGPCVYLDDYYKEYETGGMEFCEAVDEIYRQIKKHLHDIQDVNISGFLKWETAKSCIYAKLINAGQNREQLETVPHRMFLDMAVVYYAVIGSLGAQDIGAILVRNQHMAMWGQNEETLYKAAMLNMRLDGESLFEDMGTVLKGIMPEGIIPDRISKPGINMYVLTNHRKLLGAAEILDSATLKEIGDRLEDDFIVLPSSVHETIIIPLSKAPAYSELASMVYEINMTQVDLEERLSNHVYVYERSKGALRIAG